MHNDWIKYRGAELPTNIYKNRITKNETGLTGLLARRLGTHIRAMS